ncbi:MAG: CapA family protein [Endomicrobiia bacterium]
MKKIFLLAFLYIFTFINPAFTSEEGLINETTEYILIKCVGDTMLGSITPKYVVPNDIDVFNEISCYLKDADLVICNLEGVFIEENHKPSEHKIEKKNAYIFGMPCNLVDILRNLNINVVCMNNNHIMDYGQEGYNYTKKLLTSTGIFCATKEEVAKIEVKNTKIAVVAFSFVNSKFSILRINEAKKLVSQLKQENNIVVVSFHGGKEGEKALHTKDETEYFLNENRGNVVKFARTAVEAGADLVFGHGPHVLRAAELYKGKLIAYSLGNFLTYGNFNLSGKQKYGGILEVFLEKNGTFIKANFIPTVQKLPGIPVYDKEKTSIKILNSLGEKDFPNTYYKFDIE